MSTEMLSESELDKRLRRADPVSRAALVNEHVDAALTSTLRDVTTSRQSDATRRSSRLSAYRWRWARFAAAVATAGLASLVGVETLTGGAGGAGLPLAVTPAAAAQLREVANAAAAQATPGTGQFEYTAVTLETTADPSFGGASVHFTYDLTEQTWAGPIPSDESRQLMTGSGIAFPSPQDRANYLANKSAVDAEYGLSLGTQEDLTAPVVQDALFPARGPKDEGKLTPIQSEILNGTERPGSPQELLHDLTLSFDGAPSDLWSGLVTILRDSTDAQLRATAYQALAYVPGTTMLGNRTDQLGRVGAAIQFTDQADSWTQTIIVSQSTGYILQEDDSVGGKAPAMSQRSVYSQRGIVNSITALPGGGDQPFTSATETQNLAQGTETPTLQTKAGAQSQTSTAPDTTTTGTQTATDPQTTPQSS